MSINKYWTFWVQIAKIIIKCIASLPLSLNKLEILVQIISSTFKEEGKDVSFLLNTYLRRLQLNPLFAESLFHFD